MKNTAQLHKVKVTKNTVRYDSDDDVPVPAVYVKKDHLPQPFPDSITLTIET